MAIDSRGFQLVPQGGDLLGNVANAQGIQGKGQAQFNQEQLRMLIGQGTPEALEEARRLNPQAVQKFEQTQLSNDKAKFNQIEDGKKRELSNFVLRSERASGQGDAAQQEAFLRGEADKILAINPQADVSDTLELADAVAAGEGDARFAANRDFGSRTGILSELRSEATGADGLDTVKSSKINEDGSATIVTKGGQLKTIAPDELGAQIVANANKVGINLQRDRAQSRVLGGDAAKGSTLAVKQVSTLRGNNATLRQVIDEVRDGAETGPLSAKLPSFRAESVRLDQLRNKLGLDVVGSVTFGALSEGELQLAMSTALPTKLNGPELIQWADDKIEAQEKLAKYFEDQAIFLGKRGNTQPKWLEQQKLKSQQTAPEQAAQPQTQALPQGVSEDDITETMRANNMTREEVLQRLQ